MNVHLEKDWSGLDQLLGSVQTEAVRFLASLEQLPTSRPKPLQPAAVLPETGSGAETAMRNFFVRHADKLVSSAGARYWGFVTGGVTPAALAGDWLTAVFDQNPQGTDGGGDISAAIELETVVLLRQLFGLPAIFNGGFVSGATMANFTALAVARQWAGLQTGNDIAREGVKTGITVLAATPHSSAIKCLSMLGIGSTNLVPVKCLAGNREAIDPEDLGDKLERLAGAPAILISSGGTVNTVDFDDMQRIAALKNKYSFFWHIDAAFGAFAVCSPGHAGLLKGWENADSITVDFHKWLNVPYDSACYFIRDKYARLQVETFQNSNAPYLGDPAQHFSYLNSGPDNSRRLRALPAWFSLNAYGRDGVRSMVENSIRLAAQFGARLEKETGFSCAAPVRLNVVCFSRKDGADCLSIFQRLNAAGKIFVTPTQYNGRSCLRAAFVNWRTTDADLDVALEELIRAEAAETSSRQQ